MEVVPSFSLLTAILLSHSRRRVASNSHTSWARSFGLGLPATVLSGEAIGAEASNYHTSGEVLKCIRFQLPYFSGESRTALLPTAILREVWDERHASNCHQFPTALRDPVLERGCHSPPERNFLFIVPDGCVQGFACGGPTRRPHQDARFGC